MAHSFLNGESSLLITPIPNFSALPVKAMFASEHCCLNGLIFICRLALAI